MNWRPTRGLALAAGLFLLCAAVLLTAQLGVRPRPVEQLRFNQINADADSGGPIATMWSIETYSDVLYTEGPRALAAPSQIRLVRQDGHLSAPQPVRTLDPAVNVGVCMSERPPFGTS